MSELCLIMEKLKVSVIVPTYKRSEMLPRAIRSCLEQSYSNIEIVVVDDNNPDSEWRIATEKRMEQFRNEERVLYIKHDKNLNGNAARNTGIRNASGDLITYLDDDDWYYTDKVKKQVEYLIEHPEHRAVYCGWLRGGEILPEGEGDLSYSILNGQNIIITNSIMMWKQDTIESGGWDETLKRHQEASLLLNYFRYGGLIGRVPSILVEFDMTDRQNNVNPFINEQIIQYILNKYNDLVNRCESSSAGSKRRIFALRYKGIVYNYILCKEWRGAFKALFYINRICPLTFNKILIKDIFMRLTRSSKAPKIL